MRKTYLILALMLLLVVGLVYGVSPFTPQTSGTLTIEAPKLPSYMLNPSGFDAYWHVFNNTGYAVTAPAVNCTIHVYNKSAIHVAELKATMENTDYEVPLGPNITNIAGEYGFIIWCEGEKEAGAISSTFTISSSQVDPSFYPTLIYGLISMIAFILWVGFKLDERHAPIKLFLVWLSFGLFVLLVSFMQIYAKASFMGPNITSSIDTLYYVSIILVTVVSAYFMIFYLSTLLEYINKVATDKRWWGKNKDAKDKSR